MTQIDVHPIWCLLSWKFNTWKLRIYMCPHISQSSNKLPTAARKINKCFLITIKNYQALPINIESKASKTMVDWTIHKQTNGWQVKALGTSQIWGIKEPPLFSPLMGKNLATYTINEVILLCREMIRFITLFLSMGQA